MKWHLKDNGLNLNLILLACYLFLFHKHIMSFPKDLLMGGLHQKHAVLGLQRIKQIHYIMSHILTMSWHLHFQISKQKGPRCPGTLEYNCTFWTLSTQGDPSVFLLPGPGFITSYRPRRRGSLGYPQAGLGAWMSTEH